MKETKSLEGFRRLWLPKRNPRSHRRRWSQASVLAQIKTSVTPGMSAQVQTVTFLPLLVWTMSQKKEVETVTSQIKTPREGWSVFMGKVAGQE